MSAGDAAEAVARALDAELDRPRPVAEARNWPEFRGKARGGIADGQHPPVSWDLSVTSTPVTGVKIGGTHPGDAAYLALAVDGSNVSLTAPTVVPIEGSTYTFDRWVLDGVDQPAGLATLDFVADADATAEAVYELAAGTVRAELAFSPSSGVVPFTTQATATLENLSQHQIRRLAGRIQGPAGHGPRGVRPDQARSGR